MSLLNITKVFSFNRHLVRDLTNGYLKVRKTLSNSHLVRDLTYGYLKVRKILNTFVILRREFFYRKPCAMNC